MKRFSLIAGLILMAGLLTIAVIGPTVWGDAATRMGVGSLPASGRHWFGTDRLGRDVFARTMVATRLTLVMTFGAAALAAVAGVALGSAVWVAGRRVRAVGLRLIDAMVSYPAVIFALVVVAVLGPGAGTSVIAIGLATCPAFARLTANLVASVAGRDYVWSARLLGVSRWRLLRRHILPNVAEPLLVLSSVAFSVSLKALSGLSFLGLGPSGDDWGHLLQDGLQDIYTDAAPALGPSAAIVVAGLAGALISDGLAAAIDPRDRHLVTMRRTPKKNPAVTARAVAAVAEVAEVAAVAEVAGLDVLLPGGVKLVDTLALRIAEGEIVGVVGESGSGKSLTALALAGLLPDGVAAEAETLSVAGLDPLAADTDRAALAQRVGIVYQDPGTSFNPVIRIGTQVTETLQVHGGVSGKEAAARAVAALDRVRVTEPEHRMKQYPHELSGGMRQRAMIASALLTRPRLLIADEPTTALDVTVQAEVLELLSAANAEDGTAILLISHDIGVVSAICHRVLVMYSGRIVEELSGADLAAGTARHPYTKALLAATPRTHLAVAGDLATIPGRPPIPARRPAGCAFQPRCAAAVPVCERELPPLVDGVACHLVNAASVEGVEVVEGIG